MSDRAKFDVRPVANLARLSLSEAEMAEYSAQLEHILEYVAKLDGLDVSGIEPTAHANPVFDVLRTDEARAGFGAEKALQNAPRKSQDQFLVPKVVE